MDNKVYELTARILRLIYISVVHTYHIHVIKRYVSFCRGPSINEKKGTKQIHLTHYFSASVTFDDVI